MTITEAIEKVLAGIDLADTAVGIAEPAVVEVATFAVNLARKRDIDVTDLLIGDDEHDRAVLMGAELQGEMEASGIDWSALATGTLTAARTLATAVGALVTLFG